MEKTGILDADEISSLLMRMVLFGAGHPYRFPELQQLAYSVPHRNVFVDDKSRRLQLYCTYNKNKSSGGILKTMDGVTSDHLFYFIVVLRWMQINVLRGSSRQICVTLDPQSAKLMEHISPAERTRLALPTYVFLDSNRGDLINYPTFRRYLEQFPKGERERLTFQELRQGLIALIREYANVSIPETVEPLLSITHELMANHSLATALSMYGVDTFSLRSVDGSMAIQLQEECSRRWIAWLQLEDGALAQEEMATERFSVKQVRHREYGSEPKSLEDLTDAGQKLFGSKFEFRNRSQEKLCNEIYLSGRPSIAVQAPTGFGKTELFHLPLVALASKKSRKNVSFVFVPYTVLLEGTLQRLSAGNLLKVAQVKQFMEVGYDGVTDVYVGGFDDLAQEEFAARIVGWESSNGKNANLCYLVIDEFHNLEAETYRRKTFDRIRKVQFDAFEKVLFLSATAAAIIADGALRRAGFKGLEEPEPGFKATDAGDSSGGMTCYPTKMFNVIEEVPLAHVHMEFLKVADSSREAFKLLKALFACEPDARAVVAVGSRRKVEELSEECKEHFRITWTHGHLKTGEKIGADPIVHG
ncbi:hypothetical protein HG537_0B07020 [Torulaspora globosa]|uniref:Helicase ATP-binding domain-containing protein n=1 Tax=Torulaspora globosa TaxID=48254 RepID=A0A7H9HNK0_9SACH|nr:hypothetical protein HG537_0B07020 [Torulaspora sp. CBS 2947]